MFFVLLTASVVSFAQHDGPTQILLPSARQIAKLTGTECAVVTATVDGTRKKVIAFTGTEARRKQLTQGLDEYFGGARLEGALPETGNDAVVIDPARFRGSVRLLRVALNQVVPVTRSIDPQPIDPKEKE